MWKCPVCNTVNKDSAVFCGCGTHKPVYAPNYCTNESCKFHTVQIPEPECKRCPECASLTTYGKLINDLC